MRLKNRRTATVITNEDTHFAILDKVSYSRALGKAFAQVLKDKVQFLMSFKIFQGLSMTKLENLTYYLHSMECLRGQVLYSQGKDVLDYIYFVKSGEFEILKTVENPYKRDKEQFIQGS